MLVIYNHDSDNLTCEYYFDICLPFKRYINQAMNISVSLFNFISLCLT